MVPDGVVMDIVELAPAVDAGRGERHQGPVGGPVALKATDWATPAVTAVLMVLVAAEPAAALAEAGEAEIEKSLGAGAVTVRVKAVEWVAEVPVPVTVTG